METFMIVAIIYLIIHVVGMGFTYFVVLELYDSGVTQEEARQVVFWPFYLTFICIMWCLALLFGSINLLTIACFNIDLKIMYYKLTKILEQKGE